MREIKGLEWVRALPGPPGFAQGIKRPRGAKAAGLRYERALAKALPEAKHGQWLEFRDALGLGWAQPDLLLVLPSLVVVLECKYSWVAEGHQQVERYLPLVEKVWGLPARGMVVCKVLREGMPGGVKVTGELPGALGLALGGERVVLHWLGMGMLWPQDGVLGGAHAA